MGRKATPAKKSTPAKKATKKTTKEQAPAPVQEQATEETAEKAPEAAPAETSVPDAATTPSEGTDAPDSADITEESSSKVDNLYRYRRKTGWRPAEVGGKTYRPGEIHETEEPNTIPVSFLDGWDVLNTPDDIQVGDVKLPVITPVEGGFDVFLPNGNKVNDKPLPMKRAQELVDGLGS